MTIRGKWSNVVSMIIVGAGLLFILAWWIDSKPRYFGPETDHFKDGRFFHPLLDVKRNPIKWFLTRTPHPWHASLTNPPRTVAVLPRVEGGRLLATMVGHSSVLLQTDGVNWMTDPVFSERVGPTSWIGQKRRRPVALSFDEVPKLDLIVISHDHYDHLDLPTLKKFSDRDAPKILIGLGGKALLESAGIRNVQEMDWNQEFELKPGFKIHFLEAVHWCRRGVGDENRRLWGSYLFETPGGKVYFTGDTGFGPHYQKVYDRFGPMRLALLSIGAYAPPWFMGPAHQSPESAVQGHLILHARHSMAVHFGTFQQADESDEDQVRDFQDAVAKHQLPEGEFVLPNWGNAQEF